MDDLLAPFDENVKKNISLWLMGPFDEETKNEVKALIQKDPETAKNAFFKRLSFGTAGARGIMGVGSNRLNKYTIRAATQGLCNYLIKEKKNKNLKVLIGYDNRNNSFAFAKEAAKVLSGNGITCYIFEELRPTPLISFGCRHLKCSAAIMITASHNPPEYNGFKVYWDDGAQILPPHDTGIIDEVNKIESPDQVKVGDLNSPFVYWISDSIDKAYLEKLQTLNHLPSENKKNGSKLGIIYTNLHGAGITLIPKALEEWGFTNISIVKKQATIDGNFPFAKSPNPEEKSTLNMGIELLIEKKGDIFIATDPDADRMGVVVNHKGQPIILTGNEIACIFLHHLIQTGKTPKNGACIKSIVTTELFRAIAQAQHITCIDVLTGFKYIAEKIRLWEESSYQFLFGAEESYGYLFGTFVRDKDAVSASCIIAEAALLAKTKGQSLIDLLYEIYKTYGLFREKVVSIAFSEGKAGMDEMKNLMLNLRKDPPKTLSNCEIAGIEDYLSQEGKDLLNHKTYSLDLPPSDVLLFWLDDKSKIVVRPSGTEPKIKIYIMVSDLNCKNIEEGIKKLDERLLALTDAIRTEIST